MIHKKKNPTWPETGHVFDEKRKAIAQMREEIYKLGIDPKYFGIFLDQIANSYMK